MNALASALENCARIVRESGNESTASDAIWEKLIEVKSHARGRNAYTENMVRGYLAVLKALGAPEMV